MKKNFFGEQISFQEKPRLEEFTLLKNRKPRDEEEENKKINKEKNKKANLKPPTPIKNKSRLYLAIFFILLTFLILFKFFLWLIESVYNNVSYYEGK